MKVHQLLSAAGPVDAVTAQAEAYRRLMDEWGLAGEVFAGLVEPRMDGAVKPIAKLESALAPDDVLLLHHSAHNRGVSRAMELPQRKLLVYHNITPARFLWRHQPIIAVLCAIGRQELSELAPRVHSAAAVSAFNARELEEAGFRDVAVVPNLIDRTRLEEPPERREEWRDGKTNVLFVGRPSPNKRHDLVIKAFSLFQRHHAPESRLILVGEPISPGYRSALVELARRLGARDVDFESGLSQAQLNGAYSDSDLFLCLSEHEGFCIPLLEAMHFGLPVIAHRAGGVPEVCGDAAVLLDSNDPATAAAALDLVASRDGLRRELVERGSRRLDGFSFQQTAAKLHGWLEAALA
jgi:L-malate glycosyltransferase